MPYNPLDDGLAYSTVNLEGGPIILGLWSLILSNSANREGVTALNPMAVQRLWSRSRHPMSLEEIQEAWDFLAAEDPRSANQEEGGRRIVPLGDGRWKVVSHRKYRERYAEERRRAQWAEAQQRKRARAHAEEGGEPCTNSEPVTGAGPAEAPAPASTSSAPAGSADPAAEQPAPRSSPPAGQSEPRVRVVDGNGRARPAFEPSTWYETPEAHEADVQELMRVVRETAVARYEAGLPDADGAAVMAEASQFQTRNGPSGVKLNPRTMKHERLKATLLDARKLLARAVHGVHEKKAHDEQLALNQRVAARNKRDGEAFEQAIGEAAAAAGLDVTTYKLSVHQDREAKARLRARAAEILRSGA